MIFEPLWKSAQKGELILVDGGLCHWHLRKDGQITIREIIVLPGSQRRGIGRAILQALKTKGASSIFAKCPCDLESNGWYERMGFLLKNVSKTRTGREINEWRLRL